MGFRRSPFLNRERHWLWSSLSLLGLLLVSVTLSEAWKNSVNVGVSSSASVLSSLVGMWSGRVALCSFFFSFFSILCRAASSAA